MQPTLSLTIASFKIYFRNPQALFWTLLFPLIFIVIFGLVDFGSFSEVELGIVDEARNEASVTFIEALEELDIIDLSQGSRQTEIAMLEEGDRHLVAVLPAGFGEAGSLITVQGYFNDARLEQARVGASIVRSLLEQMNLDLTGTERLFTFEGETVSSRGLDYVDFLVPGVIAMSVMQTGIFGVTFTFIQYRNQGVLRRLKATPIRPHHFLTGQVLTRLIASILQTVVLLGVAVLVFDLNVEGNVGVLLLLAVVGGVLFLSMGFAISGYAKSEEVGAPLTNVIALPMMFLSGVFFPIDILPGPVEAVVQYLPLTYLVHGVREVAMQGESIAGIGWDFLGLGVWTVLAFALAARAFRWE